MECNYLNASLEADTAVDKPTYTHRSIKVYKAGRSIVIVLPVIVHDQMTFLRGACVAIFLNPNSDICWTFLGLDFTVEQASMERNAFICVCHTRSW